MSGHRPRCVSDSSLRVQPIADQPSPGSTLPGFFRFQNPGRVLPGLKRGSLRRDRRTGFTLVEMMVAVGLTVLMMTMVVTIFGLVMDGIRDSRGAIEVTDRLRAAKTRLQLDLMELTAPLTPPLDPAMGLGYFEYIEGPIGPVISPSELAASDTPNPDGSSNAPPDTTVGDNDDILMFTVTSNDEPFIGRAPFFNKSNNRWEARPVQSYTAEIAWFVRGSTLYRRTLLVLPNMAEILKSDVDLPTFNQFQTYVDNLPLEEQAEYKSIYQFSDISFHLKGDFSSDPTGGDLQPAPNTLNDLTNRENRYAHQPFAWPHDARLWAGLGLPTTQEYSSGVLNYGDAKRGAMAQQDSPIIPIHATPAVTPQLFFPQKLVDGQTDFQLIGISNDPNNPCPRLFLPGTYPFPNVVSGTNAFDAWLRPHPSNAQEPVTGQITNNTLRMGEDVILTNVIGFDVKVWDPGAPVITLNDTNRGFNGQAILPTDSLFGAPPDETVPKMAIAAALDRLDEFNPTGDNDQIVGYGAYVDLNYMCRLGLPSPQMSAPFDVNSAKRTISATGEPQFPIQDLDSPDPPKPLNDPVYAMRDINPPRPQFHHHGDMRSGLFGTFPIASISRDPDDAAVVRDLLRPSVYDTFSTAYENDAINQADVPWNPARIVGDPVLPLRSGVNGLDDNGDGAVDESSAWPKIRNASPVGFAGEKETAPPYPHPLRGIQVKIRVFEPATRQIREVTVEHEVLTQ